MSNCCDRFVMIEGEEDSFETWQGLRGPYYTPSVSEDGTLSWTNNGDLQNPADVNLKGPPGPGGKPGGTTGQLLAKASDEDFDTEWIDQPEMDAGHVSYDPTEAYDDGTVGKELGTINSALTSLSAVTEIIDTASGAIASFPDGAGLPMRSLLAQIEPQQDLHGYDTPWAGGGGANKLPPSEAEDTTVNGIRFQVDGEGKINISGTATANAQITRSIQEVTFPSSDIYVHLLNPVINANVSLFFWYNGTNVAGITLGSSVNRIYNLTALSGATINQIVVVVVNGQTVDFTFSPMLCLDNVAKTFTPYSNECPISGWTGLSGERCGINLWDEEWEVGAISTSTGQNTSSTTRIRSKNYIPVDPEKTFWFVGTGYNAEVLFYDKYKSFISKRSPDVPTAGGLLNQPSSCYFVRFTMYSGYGTTYKNDISINCPSTDTAYHAHTSLPITVSWQTEAGTVYGGTVDVVTGVLTVDSVILEPTVCANGAYSAQNKYIPWVTATGCVNNAEALSNTFKQLTTGFMSAVSFATRNGYIAFNPNGEGYATADEAKTAGNAFLSANNVQFVYKVSTPQTYQLTPQQISTLIGNNTVFVDCGSVSVTYQASIKGYIDKVLGA